MVILARLSFVTSAGMILAVGACQPEATAPEDVGFERTPQLSIVSTSLCSFREGPVGPVLDVTVRNTGIVNSGGGETISLAIGNDARPGELPPINVGDDATIAIPYPTIPGGDWTVVLQLMNLQPVSQRCIG